MSRGGRIEIFRHLFAAIAEEMGATLRLAAYSPNIKERLDFSCALFDARAELLAQAMHIPVHLGAMSMSVTSAVARLELEPGDVAMLNDPYAGGSHLPDITMVTPIYRKTGQGEELLGYTANRAHHADIGGMSPGSMPNSSSIFQEGLRIPPVKLVKRGKPDRDLLALVLANVRGAEERLGDLRAQQAACEVGARRVLELFERYGADEIAAAQRELLDYSERSMASAIAALPAGTYRFEDCLDDDGASSAPVPIRVAITHGGGRAIVDFTGSAPPSPGPVNAVEAVTLACVGYAFACLARGDIPTNQGALRPVQVIVPKPSLLAAEYPSAVVAGNVETSQRIVDVILGALALAAPRRFGAASAGSMNTITLGGLGAGSGREWSYVETLGGGMGGRPGSPGLSGVHTHMTNTLNTPVEALELAYPLRVRRYHLRAATGGAGKHPGGDGLVREIEALAPCQGSLLADRRRTQPYGLAGGAPGSRGRDSIRRADGREETIPSKTDLELQPGDRLIVETPGGGGWGEVD